MAKIINPMPKLPPDSEPIIRDVGWPKALCVAVGLMCLTLIVFVILRMFGG